MNPSTVKFSNSWVFMDVLVFIAGETRKLLIQRQVPLIDIAK